MGESLVAGEAEDRSARRSACFPKDGDLPEPPERSSAPPRLQFAVGAIRRSPAGDFSLSGCALKHTLVQERKT